MPKEMIVSVNGREKKIAVIENGRVTEFYIERGESGQDEDPVQCASAHVFAIPTSTCKGTASR